MQDMHSKAPAELEYFPAMQNAHDEDPDAPEYVPTTQSIQSKVPDAVERTNTFIPPLVRIVLVWLVALKLASPYSRPPLVMASAWSVSDIHGSSVLPARLYHTAEYGAALMDDFVILRFSYE